MVKHGHFDKWIDAAAEWKERDNLVPIKRMVNEVESLGYSATLDQPMNLFAPALIHVRPDAKVLWNYRFKGVEDWYRSIEFIAWFFEPLCYARSWKWIIPNTVGKIRPLLRVLLSFEMKPGLSFPDDLERPLPWYERLRDNEHPMHMDENVKRNWTQLYQEFPEKLQRALVEAKGREALDSQYLEYAVQDGWDPLLTFLLDEEAGREEIMTSLSQTHFPHVNDRLKLMKIHKVLDFIGMTFPLFIILFCYVAIASVRGLFWSNNKGGKHSNMTKIE